MPLALNAVCDWFYKWQKGEFKCLHVREVGKVAPPGFQSIWCLARKDEVSRSLELLKKHHSSPTKRGKKDMLS